MCSCFSCACLYPTAAPTTAAAASPRRHDGDDDDSGSGTAAPSLVIVLLVAACVCAFAAVWWSCAYRHLTKTHRGVASGPGAARDDDAGVDAGRAPLPEIELA